MAEQQGLALPYADQPCLTRFSLDADNWEKIILTRCPMATKRADDNDLRIATVDKIRTLMIDHPEVEVFCHHDIEEFTLYANQSGW